MSSYKDTLISLMKFHQPPINLGEAIIYIWDDEDHYNNTSDNFDNVRFLRVNSQVIDHIRTKYRKEDMTMACVGFGKNEDHEDLVIVYFIEFTLSGPIPRLSEC